MNTINKFFILILVVSFSISINAQEEKETFKPSGKPVIKVFANYNTNLSEETHGFELKRAYLGYKYNLSENFSTAVTLDVGNPGNESKFIQTAFLKTAALNYKNGDFSASFGLIGTRQFKLQEKNWGYRYIYKSFQDVGGFNTSADMGLNLAYKLTDMFTAEAFIYNGEGYKKLQMDTAYKVGLGLTAKPMKELTVRLVYDTQNKGETEHFVGAFAGYDNKKFRFGAEYNMKSNAGYVADQTLSGMSFYSTYKITDDFGVFARYDSLGSSTSTDATDPWNIDDNGSFIIGGVEYTPIKNVSVSLNFQNWTPEITDAENTQKVYLNFQYKI